MIGVSAFPNLRETAFNFSNKMWLTVALTHVAEPLSPVCVAEVSCMAMCPVTPCIAKRRKETQSKQKPSDTSFKLTPLSPSPESDQLISLNIHHRPSTFIIAA
jgi:hypothetical protein